MSQDIINNDLVIRGTLSATRFLPPAGSITNAAIQADAEIAETKLQHRHSLTYSANGTVAAATEYLHVMPVGGALLSIEAAITETIATGADRTVNVDLQKSTGGGAFATVLTATIEFDNASDLLTAVAGVLASTALVAGDILKIVVTVAGAAGNQALGLVVTVQLREDGV